MESEKIYLIFAYISSAAPLLPLVAGTLHYKAFNPVLKVLFLYILLTSATEGVGQYLSYYHRNNLFLYYIFTFLEFTCFCVVYSMLFNKPRMNILFYALIPLFGIFVALEAFYFGDILQMNVVSRNTESGILILFSILYFFDLLSKLENKNVVQLPSFWINTAVLIYFSGNFFLFLFSNYLLTQSISLLYALYSIHSFLNIIFNAMLAFAFTKE